MPKTVNFGRLISETGKIRTECARVAFSAGNPVFVS